LVIYRFDIVVEGEKNNEIKEIFNKYIPNVYVIENRTTNNEKMFTYFQMFCLKLIKLLKGMKNVKDIL